MKKKEGEEEGGVSKGGEIKSRKATERERERGEKVVRIFPKKMKEVNLLSLSLAFSFFATR